jgi:hypothetical protein
MAGFVRTVLQSSIDRTILRVMPLECPVDAKPGLRNYCLAVDLAVPHVNLCPFLQRFRLEVGGSDYELMTVDAMLQWLASQDVHQGYWKSLCMRRESKGTDAGAQLRP